MNIVRDSFQKKVSTYKQRKGQDFQNQANVTENDYLFAASGREIYVQCWEELDNHQRSADGNLGPVNLAD
jgi:hypothetical protein